MKKNFIFLIIFPLIWCNLFAMQSGESFKNFKKISDSLYTAEIVVDVPTKCYIAMEKIDKSKFRIDSWLQYAHHQSSCIQKMNLTYVPSSDGADRLKNVLQHYKDKSIEWTNDLWIVYASCKPVKDRIVLNPEGKNPSIEMYMSVITSEKALITSHMGISRTYEAAEEIVQERRVKVPYQSLYLHAFAAKVMKVIDPRKVYMMTAPNKLMHSILIKKFPQDNPTQIRRTKNDGFLLKKCNGGTIVAFDKNDAPYQWIYTKPYKDDELGSQYISMDLTALENFGVK